MIEAAPRGPWRIDLTTDTAERGELPFTVDDQLTRLEVGIGVR